MSSQNVRPAAGANDAEWDGSSPGHYEVWYLTMSDPASRRGFWFRYTLEVPAVDRAEPPVAELWGFAFTPGEPARGGKVTRPLEWPPKGIMHVGDALLEEGHAVGDLPDVGLSWDVEWEPSMTAMWHIPGKVGRSKVPSTRVVSPTVDASFRGRVRVGDEEIELTDARGCQTHLWGRQHAARWAWGHCSAFAADDGSMRDDVLVEAVTAVPLLRPDRPAPAGFTMLYAEVAGEVLAANAFPWVVRAKSHISGHRWEIRGRTRSARLRVVLEANPSEMAQVTYEDPDGSHAYCINSEIARGALEVERGDGRVERFTSEGLAHVEFGARQPHDGVPILC
jgi:hypothetical protein